MKKEEGRGQKPDQGLLTSTDASTGGGSQLEEAAAPNPISHLPSPSSTLYRFDVIDTGSGISEAAQKEIFQPFQQSEAGLKKGGTGLGLAISRRQVELMGGKIKLESTPGKGSRFYFEISLPPARGQLVAQQAGEAREVVRLAASTQVNALVVDDNQNNRDVLSQLLNGIGCRVRVAESALAAFDRVKEELPDIIFMDIRMPGMNGAEATKRIIAEHGPDKIKIVAITASVLEHEKAGHMKAGFHSFLAKPFRFPDVCASLKQFLKVEFEYADEEVGEAGAGEAMDASRCSIPLQVWEALKEAAERYSLTGLKKAMEPLEKNGDAAARKTAEYLKRLIHEGDLDRVSAFLDEVKEKGGLV
jgi:CheY-like chemotaxis protein